jgi:hypothetical protein
MTETLPIPPENPDSAPYWRAAREERLEMQRCAGCGRFRFPPSLLCPHCHGEGAEWAPLSGRGRIVSFSIVHRAPAPAFQARVPYVLALVDLEEGPRMMANVVGEGALEVAIDDAVEVVFEARGDDGFKLPQFRRAGP